MHRLNEERMSKNYLKRNRYINSIHSNNSDKRNTRKCDEKRHNSACASQKKIMLKKDSDIGKHNVHLILLASLISNFYPGIVFEIVFSLLFSSELWICSIWFGSVRFVTKQKKSAQLRILFWTVWDLTIRMQSVKRRYFFFFSFVSAAILDF